MDGYDSISSHHRRRILEIIQEEGEITPTVLLRYFPFKGPTLTVHLNNLVNAELLDKKRVQNNWYYSINKIGLEKLQKDFMNLIGPTFKNNLNKENNKIEENNNYENN